MTNQKTQYYQSLEKERLVTQVKLVNLGLTETRKIRLVLEKDGSHSSSTN